MHCMDGAEVGVLKQADKIGFHGLLQGHDFQALEMQVHFKVLGYLPD